MSHGNSITYCDRWEYNWCSTCHSNSKFYCIYDLVNIHMPWHDLIIRTYIFVTSIERRLTRGGVPVLNRRIRRPREESCSARPMPACMPSGPEA